MRDDVAGALRHPDLAPVLQDLHELPEHDLGFAGRESQRFQTGLQRLHLPVMVGAPDVDEMREPAVELVAVVRKVVAEIRRGAVAADQDPIAAVAEVGGAQPVGAVRVVGVATRVELRENVGDITAFVQDALGEPRVEMHADALEIGANLPDDVEVAPLASVLEGHRVAELGAHARGHLVEIRPAISVLGNLLASVPSEQRRTEQVELCARVVEVVLPMHLRALRREEIRNRIADRNPAPTTRMQRTGRVDRDEFEVHALACERGRRPEARAGTDHLAQHFGQPRRREEDVDEARRRNFDFGHMRHIRGAQRIRHTRCNVERIPTDDRAQHHRDIRRPIAVIPAPGRVQHDLTGGFGQLGGGQRPLDGSAEVVADQTSSA